jgi:putative DNA primase/helicase
MDDVSDFSPLSDVERNAAIQELARDGELDAAKPTYPPPDAEPPEAAAARLFGRAPDTLWRYHDTMGALVFCVCRWNFGEGRKEIRPLSWFDGEGWRFGHWQPTRPLYNLDRIAAEPNAPIVVCEGEKAADAAARIFPKSIATTSSSGAKAANKTDWAPLAGRRVLVWPDNDEPGAKYALEVAVILAELDCDLLTIDAAALAAQPNAREPEGWDAANALVDWPDLAALRKAAAGASKPFDPGPAYLCFPPYTMDVGGLRMEKTRGKRDTEQTERLWIAAPFEVLGECRDPQGGDWGKVLRWRDDDRRTHMRHVADADLHGEPAALCASLAGHGLRIDRDRQRDLIRYLSAVRAKRRVTIVKRTGWHEIGGRSVFVLPGETIGPRGGERVILDALNHAAYEARGTIEEWRAGVGKLASGHALAVLAISAALTGPLLYLAGGEGGGIHLFGQSSKGKTTILQAAASVWGRGASPGYVRAWRATANGLEGAAALATDTALVLDEMGVLDARDAGAAIYSLANGGGKQRAARDGSLCEPQSWRVIFVSSGENPFEAKLTESKGKARAGQLLRLLDIPADRGLGFGVFDSGGTERDAGALARAIKVNASAAYGTAGPEFVRCILKEEVTGEVVRVMVSDFVKAVCPAGADGQVERVAQRLGLLAAAGELATVFELTGWREGEARAAAARAFKQWIEGRGGTEPAEVRQAIEQVRLMIEGHGDSRFQSLDHSDDRPVNNRLGWRKGEGTQREWWVLPEMWKAEICAGLDAQFVARTLAEHGILRRQGGNVLQCTVNIGGGQRARAYVLAAAILDRGENAD